MIIAKGGSKGIMLGDKWIKLKVTAFPGAIICTSKEARVPVDNIHVHHHDAHLQPTDRTVITVTIAEENQCVLISNPRISYAP